MGGQALHASSEPWPLMRAPAERLALRDARIAVHAPAYCQPLVLKVTCTSCLTAQTRGGARNGFAGCRRC